MKKNVGKKIRLMALLASLTLVLWGGVIACSSDSDDDGGSNQEEIKKEDETETTGKLGTIKSESVTMEANPIEFVSATMLSNLNITSLRVAVTEASYTGDSEEDWSFKILTSASWENETELPWSDDIKGYEKTISGDTLEKFKSSGIFVYGWPTGITGKVTITYE